MGDLDRYEDTLTYRLIGGRLELVDFLALGLLFLPAPHLLLAAAAGLLQPVFNFADALDSLFLCDAALVRDRRSLAEI